MDIATQRQKATNALYEQEHSLASKEGVTKLLSVVANALIHEVPGFNVAKANTLTYQSSVALRALEVKG